MVECGARPGHCEQEPTCPVRINWGRISREVERALDSVPISDMIAGCTSHELLPVGPSIAGPGSLASGAGGKRTA
jgi:DNA-binding IscR family transcriptional regulator